MSFIAMEDFVLGAKSAEILRYFPAGSGGEQPALPLSGWRIQYEILKPQTPGTCLSEQAYGCSAVLEIQSVEFMRGRKPSGEEDWIKILNKLALVELMVVYNDRETFFDIYQHPFTFANPTSDVAAARNFTEVRDDGIVVELLDDHVRWASSASSAVRRGQVLDVWAILLAGNYSYIVRYSFADDGTIRARVGATGRNLRNVAVGTDTAIHVHAPIWRLEFDLGSAASNSFHIVERRRAQNLTVDSLHRKFNGGMEGGEVWNPEAFTSLMVVNSHLRDKHEPPHNAGYKLISVRSGSLRTHHAQTLKDFWVTRVTPSDPIRRQTAPELRYIDLMEYLQRPEPIEGHATAVWHSSPVQHIPRTEDFGRTGYSSADGLTLTMWSGFDLMPHNLWGMTPFYAQ